MEKNVLLLIVVNAFSLGCFAQYNERFQIDPKAVNSKLISDRISQKELAIVSYHVEERINMRFGSSITTYNVPNVDLINTNDLGENNTRKVTPKYARVRARGLNTGLSNALVASTAVKPMEVDVVIPVEKKTFVKVNVLRTYERVLEKGYLSVDMLRKVADWRYFEGDLETAAKWYIELHCMTNDLDEFFYYRYAQSLKAIGQIERAKEMMVIFESKR
ncbi:hypothetical protein [Flavobacterium terrisoli]|uniref:hypothetical protein n=1 Tax=Flavobacterium terrisoli TaxID=3242195 RepID=UPI002542F925|nr:hypothetical protein [Flavobacterium buctense]